MKRYLLLIICFIASSTCFAEDLPWWDDFPTIVQVPDLERAKESNAIAVLNGAADDPVWGIYLQRQRMIHGAETTRQMHEAGLKVMAWFEGFGTTQSNICEIRKNPDGTWIKNPLDDTLTTIFHNHWSWEHFDGTGEIHWIGAPNYFDADDFVAPWTRLHPEYGCGPMRYPDGTIANGYEGDSSDPRNSRMWDAGCSKNVLGKVTFEYNFNDAVNKVNSETRQLAGPIDGLLKMEEDQLGVPDPGFTPEEWKKLKSASYAGVVAAGKDTGCPVWLEYLEASMKDALAIGTDGLWVDNFSPWDSFNAMPVLKAFGEWSVAGFRPFLRKNLSSEQITELKLSDLETFDVRIYLQNKCREFGGDPTNLSDHSWRDPRWQEDLIWRAYLVYKRQLGTEAFTKYYTTAKRVAAEAGKPDFFVSGNDIPLYSLGWIRGELDMVSTELTWGWHLTSGARGLMPPPYGCYVPISKLAREHAKSRFVNVWYYVPKDQEYKSNIARVINYQGLANHTLPMPQYAPHTIGNPEVNSAFFKFVGDIRPIVRERVPYDEQIGIYYSSSSQVMEMLPGGFRDHNSQPHSFSVYGWGTILTQLHYGWRAIPQWKLTEENLVPLKTLIIPSVSVFDRNQLPILEKWVSSGGTLVVAGDFATRNDEDKLFSVAEPLTGPLDYADKNETSFGKGKIVFMRKDPGYDFYLLAEERFAKLAELKAPLEKLLKPESLKLNAQDVSPSVGITLYQDKSKLFADVYNTSIDTKTDVITKASVVSFEIELPSHLRERELTVRVLSPENAPKVQIEKLPNHRLKITVDVFELYACVVIMPQ